MGISETKEFFRTLDQLQEALPLEAGRSSSSAHENVFLSVAAGLYDDQPSRHLVTLGWGVPPRAAVQDLPCAILSEDGSQVVSVHRTNGLGQFQVDLAPGRYAVRFVSEVRSSIDVEALLHLADEPALEYLEDCLADDQTPPDLRGQIEAALQRRQQTIGEILTAFHQGGPQATVPSVAKLPLGEPAISVLTPGGALAAKSVSPEARAVPAAPKLPGLKPIEFSEGVLTIRQPAADAPFGVVRVLAKGKSREMVLGTCLLAMPEYKTDEGEVYYSEEVNTTGLLEPENDPLGVDYYVIPAASSEFAWFPVEEVEELRRTPDVAEDADVEGKVTQLIDQLKE